MGSPVSFAIDGVDIPEAMADAGHDFYITGISGRDPIDPVIQTDENPGGDGERFIAAHLPAREILVSYAINSTSPEERRAAGRLLARLLGYSARRLTFTDQAGYYTAVGRNMEGETRPAFGRGELTFWCGDPFLYGEQRSVELDSGGVIEAETNYVVAPRIIWETDSSVGAAWIEVDGHRLTIDTGISAGGQVVIDAARKETRIGGELNVANIRGTYPRIGPSSVVETSPGGTLTFQFQERWI